MKKIISLITAICLTVILMTTCQNAEVKNTSKPKSTTVRVIDSRGKEVEVNYLAKKRMSFK